MNRKINFLIRLVVGLAIITFIYVKVGVGNIYNTLISADLGLVLIISVLFVIAMAVGIFNFKVLFSIFEKKPSDRGLIRDYFASWAVSLVAPGRIGELSMIYFLGRRGIGLGQSSAI